MDFLDKTLLIGLAYYVCFIIVFSFYDKSLRKIEDKNRKKKCLIILTVHAVSLITIGIIRFEYFYILLLLANFLFFIPLRIAYDENAYKKNGQNNINASEQ
jgi:membrane-associated HD superfamily phosphohydrolase